MSKTHDLPTSTEDDFVRTGPGTAAGRLLRRQWQPICLSRSVPAGSALPVRTMGEDFTVYKGDSGAIHLVAYRCPHRGAQLSVGWVQGDTLRCRYHGWRFQGDGRCVEQPAEPTPFCDKVRVAAYPATEYLGLVFAYLGEGEPPAFPRWDAADARVRRRADLANQTVLPCNWFQSAENIVDDVHVTFVHGNNPAIGLGVVEDVREHDAPPSTLTAAETSFGMTVTISHPERPVDHPHHLTDTHFVMPNRCYLEVQEIGLRLLFWYVPIDDTSHNHFVIVLFADDGEPPFPEPEAVLDGRRSIADVLAGRAPASIFDDSVRLQDGLAIASQGVIADRSAERLGRSDAAVILLRKLWRREADRLAKGEAVTAFEHPAHLYGEKTSV